jgi:CBS domain-containing protein
MKRWLYAYRNVTGGPEALAAILRERVTDLLRSATEEDGAPPAADGSFTVRLPTQVAGVAAGKVVRMRTGVARHADSRTVIPLSWHAEPARHAFPAFDGALELQPLSANAAQLTLVGSYTVPLGPVGMAADTLALGTVAEHAAQALIDRIAEALRTALSQPAVRAQEPAGTLLRVRDVMTPDPLVLDEGQSLRTAAMLLFHQQISGAPVTAPDGALVGVLSERDLLEKEAWPRYGLGRKATEAERRRRAVTAGQACSKPARVTTPDATLRAAAREMLDHGVSRLVAVDGSRIAGIVTRHDVLQALIRTDAEIQAGVDATLAMLDNPEVTATVAWGEVTLEGAVRLRSRIPHIVRLVEAVDGVLAVYGDLTWREDDTSTSPLLVHPTF